MNRFVALAVFMSAVTPVAPAQQTAKPTVFLIGDSTVKNGTRGQAGWGAPFAALFDPAKVNIQNRALAGRSSRSYLREGLWEKVVAEIKPGDFVIMQFGHNDNGAIDEGKARASIKGNSDETKEITIKETGQKEIVRTYGWYLRRYIADTKSWGAIPIVCSLVPRDIWLDGKVVRATETFCRWAREAAAQGGAHFLDLNDIVARRYEAAGWEKVHTDYFTSVDHTHTTPAGAELNAGCVVEGIGALQDCSLAGYLRQRIGPVSAAIVR
jgi:lysophospholipase L1-like esterase